MPNRAWASGGAAVTSTPSNRTRPAVGTASPARQLNSVDLPAPFGPMIPTISPAATSMFTPRTARKPSNALETARASSSMPHRRGRPPPERRHHAVAPHGEQAARLEHAQQDDDPAVE